jgi:PEP-CTERM/exosortase A-associated glycosyltransferase
MLVVDGANPQSAFRAFWPQSMRILHVLDHSLPYFSGYSFRSASILRAQQRLGWRPVALTSPKHENFPAEIETIDGIEYHRTPWPPISKFQAVPMVRQMASVAALTQQIKRLAAELRIDLIHAHSPSLNGLAAAQAAKALGLPWVYELRYYEEDAAVDRGKTRHNSLRYRLAARLEQQALEQADAVTTISQALREDLIRRGIAAEKITVIPNGVDTAHFQPCEAAAELISKYDLAGKTVIGFIGSFYFYEGLEFLVDAAIELLATRSDILLLLAGDGEAVEMLQNRIPNGLRGHFIFTGNVPHNEVRRYYSVMDILVYPRKRSRLTELTTPLKPLEAMAMEKAVVGSDVGGLRELFGETGFLVEAENPKALANLLLRLAESATERHTMAAKAREFVLQNRSWETSVRRYGEIYGKLLLT